MRGLPPVATAAVTFGAGATAGLHLGAAALAALLLASLAVPIRTWPRTVLLLLVTAGWLAGQGGAFRTACPPTPAGTVEVFGRFLAPAGKGTTAFRSEVRCGPDFVWTEEEVAAGVRVRVVGAMPNPGGRTLVARSVELPDSVDGAAEAAPTEAAGWALVRWRGRLVEALDRLYGDRGPVVAALILARREGLDPEVREAFARAGTAHLLAISGFHVGVVAGLILTLLRVVGVRRRRAPLAAALFTWAYVGLIGFPDAACRAALLLTAAAAAPLLGRPTARWGPLAASFLLLVLLEPDRVRGVGFQLSFAGAAGLLAWARPWTEALRRGSRAFCPTPVASALAAGAAATVATLPVVAWHFERVSVVGIPATLVASPLVATALPGALTSLLLEPIWPGAAHFLAGGVDVALYVLLAVTQWMGSAGWAAVWVPQSWVVAGGAGAVLWAVVTGHQRVSPPLRRRTRVLAAAGGIVAFPVVAGLPGWGSVEIVAVDVGQGDAIAVRSPRGRWLLVDAGPPSREGQPHPVVRLLGRRGVARLEGVILTHADADHMGGLPAVLEGLSVLRVMDPGRPVGKGGYVDALEVAAREGVRWERAEAGATLAMDGMKLRILHPPLPTSPAEGEEATNDLSVVVLLQFGAFDALLTGDAPVSVEERVAHHLPTTLEILKVGHHGSRTSTGADLLQRTSPAVALVSVGRRNRYGHPHPSVLARLREGGTAVYRTDRHGTIRVVGRRDGTFRVEPSAR